MNSSPSYHPIILSLFFLLWSLLYKLPSHPSCLLFGCSPLCFIRVSSLWGGLFTGAGQLISDSTADKLPAKEVQCGSLNVNKLKLNKIKLGMVACDCNCSKWEMETEKSGL